MKHRPSTSVPLVGDLSLRARSTRSLHRRLMVLAAVGATLVIGMVTSVGLYVLKRSMAGDEDARVENAASLSKQLVERVLAERTRQVEMIASAPSVIAAARKGGAAARERGLPSKSVAQLEEAFKATRSQQVDDGARLFLSDLLPKLDIAEVMVTDEYGYNAVTTSPPSDFVQSDESWWQTAWGNGHTNAQATADAATQRTVVELAEAIRDRGTKIGVVKVKFGLSVVDSVLAQGGGTPGSALRVDLVDSVGRIIASSVASTRFKPFPGFGSVSAHEQNVVFAHQGDSTSERATFVPTNVNRWRVFARMREADASRAYSIARWSL